MIAALLAVTTRTVRNWTRNESPRPPGRPPHAEELRLHVARQVAKCRRRQGMGAGWQTLVKHLPDCPTRLVQEELSRAKRHRRAHLARRAKARRRTTHITGRDVLWSVDATHVGRVGGKTVEAQVVRDAATMEIPALSVGPPASAEDAVALVLHAAKQRDTLPLVLTTDNGPQYRAARFTRFLEKAGVIHLRTLPHTPQHNPWVERTHRELKEESGLGKGVVLPCVDHARELLERARDRLDHQRLRPRLGDRTAAVAGAAMDARYNAELRDRLVRAVRKRVEAAVKCTEDKRERRRKERAAILSVLEEFELIRVTRGGRLTRPVKPEAVS